MLNSLTIHKPTLIQASCFGKRELHTTRGHSHDHTFCTCEIDVHHVCGHVHTCQALGTQTIGCSGCRAPRLSDRIILAKLGQNKIG